MTRKPWTSFEQWEGIPFTPPEFCALLGYEWPKDDRCVDLIERLLDLETEGKFERTNYRICNITKEIMPTFRKKQPELLAPAVAEIAREMVDLIDLSPDPLKREVNRKWLSKKLGVSVASLPPMNVLPGLSPEVDCCPHCHKMVRRQAHGYIRATEAVQGSPEPPTADRPAGTEGEGPDTDPW